MEQASGMLEVVVSSLMCRNPQGSFVTSNVLLKKRDACSLSKRSSPLFDGVERKSKIGDVAFFVGLQVSWEKDDAVVEGSRCCSKHSESTKVRWFPLVRSFFHMYMLVFLSTQRYRTNSMLISKYLANISYQVFCPRGEIAWSCLVSWPWRIWVSNSLLSVLLPCPQVMKFKNLIWGQYLKQVFLRGFGDPNRVPRIENRVPTGSYRVPNIFL